MSDLDLDNLSPEDKAMFDAMVAEEMQKLEAQFQSEANAMADIAQKPPPTSSPPAEPSSFHFDDYSSRDMNGKSVPRQQRRDDNALNSDRLSYKSPEWNNKDEVLVGRGGRQMGRGVNPTREEKQRKQLEYAAQLQDGIAAREAAVSPRDRHAAAAKRGESLSVSRSAGSYRTSEDEARRQKVQAQQKYALELQEQQSARHRADHMPADRKRVQRRTQSPIQQSSIMSSPTSTYTSAGGRSDRAAPVTDRERARQKQLEYHRQLEADKQFKAADSLHDNPRAMNQRNVSPIRGNPEVSSDVRLSERDLKHQRQQEYASQLRQDMQMNSSSKSLGVMRGNKSDVSTRQASKQERDLGIDFGGGRPQLSRREKQEEYARQIREAAEQQEISTPRQAVSARRMSQKHELARGGDSGSGTGLRMGADVATAAQRAIKRERQSKYRNELAEGSNSKPITSSRASLHSNRSRQDEELGIRGGVGFTTAGLIGNQETEAEKIRRKRENQKEYFEQLRTGPSPAKERGVHDKHGDYSEPVPLQSDYGGHSEADPPRGELSQRLTQAYTSAYEQPPPSDAPLKVEPDHNLSPRSYHQQDSYDMLREMKAESRSVLADEHYSPTRPVVAEDGHMSFDGINPPHGRHNKGMNVPDAEGRLPSARQPHLRQQQQKFLQQRSEQQLQQQQRDYEDQQYSEAHKGTSLVIGEMDVRTAEERDRKAYERQRYIQELEQEKARVPIQNERVSLIQQRKYEGNGLPGSIAPQQGGARRGPAQQAPQQGQGQHYTGHRGTSTGGGASSVVLGGGYGADESPRMRRIGGKDEYAEQLHNQHYHQGY